MIPALPFVTEVLESVFGTTPEDLRAYADEVVERNVQSAVAESREHSISIALQLRRVTQRAVYEALGVTVQHYEPLHPESEPALTATSREE